jgi:hypothetical protein
MERGWMSPRHPPRHFGIALGSARRAAKIRRMDKSKIKTKLPKSKQIET